MTIISQPIVSHTFLLHAHTYKQEELVDGTLSDLSSSEVLKVA